MALEPSVLVGLMAALGTGVGAFLVRKTGRETNHVSAFEKLSAAEARFRDSITKRLDDCEVRHRECEEAARELRGRIEALEEKVP